MITPSAAAVIFILFMEAGSGKRKAEAVRWWRRASGVLSLRAPAIAHSTGAARAVLSTMSPVAGRRYEMTDTRHEAGGTGGSITRLTPGEIFAIIAFWAFLAVLTAAGRLVDPRVAAVAAMRAMRPDPSGA